MSGWSPENKSLDFLQSTYELTRYTEFRIGIFQTRRKFPLLGMMDATKFVKTLGKTHAGMVFEDLSFFDGLFRTGMKFPGVTTMRDDR